MQLSSILTAQRTLCGAQGVSKTRVLKSIAKLIANNVSCLQANEIYDALITRERLGSTGLGDGIAIPHCRVAHCEETICALVSLQDAIEFDAIDNKAVDLFFVLLVPPEEHCQHAELHLEILQGLAELLSQPAYCERLRKARDTQQLYEAAINY